MKEIDEQQDGQKVELSVDEELAIRLGENPTTGFRWKLESKGEPACTLVDSINPTSSSGGRVGAGGIHTWKFRAAQPGEATIKLLYHRPWEKDEPPERTFTLHVNVTK